MDFYISRRLKDEKYRNADRAVDGAWYRSGPSQIAKPTLTRTRHQFKKRAKDYSDDTTESERETDGHVEHRIYRYPKGSSKE